MEWTEVVPLVVALVGVTTGLLALLKGRNKEKADVAKALAEAAGELVENYHNQAKQIEEECREKLNEFEVRMGEQDRKIACQELKIEKQALQIEIQAKKIRQQADSIKALEAERDEILKGVLDLCMQIRNLGHEPVWEPESPNN